MHEWKRLLAQFRIEAAIRTAGFLGLIFNLAYMGRLRSLEETRVVVFVDSLPEIFLLRLLRLVAVIPWCRIYVIRGLDDFHVLAEKIPDDEALLAVTPHLYLEYYQAMVGLRRKLRVVVI